MKHPTQQEDFFAKYFGMSQSSHGQVVIAGCGAKGPEVNLGSFHIFFSLLGHEAIGENESVSAHSRKIKPLAGLLGAASGPGKL